MNPMSTLVLNQRKDISFFNKLHKRKEGFKAALEWLGLFVTRTEIEAWIGDPSKSQFHDRKIIRCPTLDGPRRNAFTKKIENFTSLHTQDIVIHDYFMSSNNGFIAWLHLDAVVVDITLKETSKTPARDFKAAVFIPKIARNWKKLIDTMLLNYK